MNVPHSVFGFSENHVCIGSNMGGSWKFDSNNWNLFAELTKDEHKDIGFDNIWVNLQRILIHLEHILMKTIYITKVLLLTILTIIGIC